MEDDKNFSESEIDSVWQKGFIVKGNDPKKFRKDIAGAWICKQSYGLDSEFGWHIDHIRPKSLGGTNTLSNLQPLQCNNNLSKSNNYPEWTSAKTASGVHNIDAKRTIKQ